MHIIVNNEHRSSSPGNKTVHPPGRTYINSVQLVGLIMTPGTEDCSSKKRDILTLKSLNIVYIDHGDQRVLINSKSS